MNAEFNVMAAVVMLDVKGITFPELQIRRGYNDNFGINFLIFN